MISQTLSFILSIGLFSLLIAAALSPIESLSWWAGWNDPEKENAAHAPVETDNRTTDALYVVYLSGISTMTGHYLADQEERFLSALSKRFSDQITIVSDIFPYAPSGEPLLATPRLLQRFWRSLSAMRLKGRGAVAVLANLRNFFQVLVSADHRYGPIFNLGAATVIQEGLERHGYKRGSGAPIILIGFSGGAQIGVGATAYLSTNLAAPIDVIALGGVVSSDPGIASVRKLHRFFGSRDVLHRLGSLFFPERWAIFAYSLWNIAKRDGRIVEKCIGDMAHAGPRGYFGVQRRRDNRRYVDDTLNAVSDAISKTLNPSTNDA